MKKQIIFTLLSLSLTSPVFAHELYDKDGNYHGHEEKGVLLPFDSVFCDLNENSNIEKDEMTMDNLCVIEDGANTIFAEKPISALGLKKGELILTIDDGPNAPVTRPILDLLDQYGIKASFFITGNRIANNKALVKEMVARGHLVGNHTFSHDVKNITSSTITGEITQAHNALRSAIGKDQSRLLFRAPGLGWSAPKAINLNNNSLTRKYIGPIHANLGTDAPRADWSCWAKGVSSATCASYYFQDIVNTGRGIVLTHDIFFKSGRGNTYEMLKILLHKLDTEAGGIKNKSGSGVWTFVTLKENTFLNKYEVKGATGEVGGDTGPAPTGDGLIEEFKNPRAFIRSSVLEGGVLNDASKIAVPGGYLRAGDLVAVADLNAQVVIGSSHFKKIEIKKAKPGFEKLEGFSVYLWSEAF